MKHDAFNRELRRTIPDLIRFARAISRDTETTEELVGETLVKALQLKERFEPGSNMRAWLYKIASGLYRNMNRKRRLRSLFESDGNATVVSIPPSQDGTIDLEDAARIIASLPEEQRLALQLVTYHGHSYGSAAAILGCEIGTLKSRVSRARAEIAKALGESKNPGPSPVIR